MQSSLPLFPSLSLSLFVANTGKRHSSTADRHRSRGTSREGSRLSILPGKLGRAETASATTHATGSASASTSADRLPPQFASNGCPRISGEFRLRESSRPGTRDCGPGRVFRAGGRLNLADEGRVPTTLERVATRRRRCFSILDEDANRDSARSARSTHPLDVNAIFSRRADTCL